jgi:hypothetical protein
MFGQVNELSAIYLTHVLIKTKLLCPLPALVATKNLASSGRPLLYVFSLNVSY